jgi:hypothetical protein
LLELPVRAHNVALEDPEQAAALERELSELAAGERIWLVALTHPAWTTADEWSAIVERLRSRAREVGRLEAHGASAIEFVVRPEGD